MCHPSKRRADVLFRSDDPHIFMPRIALDARHDLFDCVTRTLEQLRENCRW
jgi:hypothetical protein